MNYYISQSVIEARDILREAGMHVGYKEKPDDPEHPNAYICSDASLLDIVAIVSSTIRWRRDRPEWDIPEGSKACVQLNKKDEIILLTFIKSKLNIIKEEE